MIYTDHLVLLGLRKSKSLQKAGHVVRMRKANICSRLHSRGNRFENTLLKDQKRRMEDNIMNLGRQNGLWMMKLAKVYVQ